MPDGKAGRGLALYQNLETFMKRNGLMLFCLLTIRHPVNCTKQTFIPRLFLYLGMTRNSYVLK